MSIFLTESFLPLMKSPTWRIFPPKWNKTFRTAQQNMDVITDFTQKHVEIAKKRIAEKDLDDPDDHEMSVLQKMILRNGPESTYPLVTAMDLLFAGIDTTGNTMGFLMYNLAANPDKQKKSRKECQALGKHLTVKDLNELKYLKACIQETNRLTPTVPAFARRIRQDMNLQGYHIPKVIH
jgi:cytochrome P450